MFRYRVILFGRSCVSISHIDLWLKKCHRWHSTDECFNNCTHQRRATCVVDDRHQAENVKKIRKQLHPCEKVIGMFFQNQIWSRLLDINRFCLVCIKRSIEEVKKCQISKRDYQQGPSDETSK